MKSVLQKLRGRPAPVSTNDPAGTRLVCNYRDNYYGDQVCINLCKPSR